MVTKSRLLPPLNPRQIEAGLSQKRMVTLTDLANRFGVSIGKITSVLKDLVANGRVRIDAQGRVHSLVVRRSAQSQKQERSAKRMVRNERRRLRERIVQNRSEWISSVDEAWLRLEMDSSAWVADRVSHLRQVNLRIRDGASEYLASPDVDERTKLRARQVLAVSDAIAISKRIGMLDPRVFKPFRWPTTEINNLERLLNRSHDDAFGRLLSRIGYRVGRNGLGEVDRRDCLVQALQRVDLPDTEHLPPHSCLRLRRIAYAIAFLIRCAKGRTTADMAEAISDWEADLVWMKKCFYLGRCDPAKYNWPTA